MIRHRRHVVLYLLLVVAGPFCAATGLGESRAPTEYEVKAAFLYNFAKYIEWPELPAADAKRPLVIGLIGKDPFGRVLDDVMRGRRLQNRAVVVRRFRTVDDVSGCDILFVAVSEGDRLERILEVLHSAPVLTVGDMDRFAHRGGMINMTTEENRIRFEINVGAVERAGLKARSQLLRLAKIVNESQVGS